jgi:hypothetical protein
MAPAFVDGGYRLTVIRVLAHCVPTYPGGILRFPKIKLPLREVGVRGLLQDVRFALRQLRKNPAYTVAATVMLAVAICANGTVFSWIDGTMLHPIPGARDMSSLVSVMRGQWNISPSPPFSYLDYRHLRDQNHSFDGITAYHHDWLALTGGASRNVSPLLSAQWESVTR